jgi:hypothetical protein
MGQRYVETRRQEAAQPAAVMADMVRYIHARQYLGMAVVVGHDPGGLAQLAQRQWLKLSRSLQQRRARSASAEEILKFTHTIAHMQHMRFVEGAPHEQPGADIYFVQPEQVRLLPLACMTLYVVEAMPAESAERLIAQLPARALVVDYSHSLPVGAHGLRSKAQLDAQVTANWHQVIGFLAGQSIDMTDLSLSQINPSESFDDALNTLLGLNVEFLQLASAFQYALDAAQPLQGLPQALREQYGVFARLANRVQSLTPGAIYTDQFLKSFVDDGFFLHDRPETPAATPEQIARHLQAGRLVLARALMKKAPAQMSGGWWSYHEVVTG